jgi:glycosyltransferase involved in cell wall biosynthesis
MYFILNNKKSIIKYIKKRELKSLLLIAAILACLIVYIPKMNIYENIKTALNHYNVNSVSDLLSIEQVDHIIFSNRLTYLNDMNITYQNSSSLEKLLGISDINKYKNVEIDIFDIFYSIGIIGFSFYLIFLLYSLKQAKLKPVYKLSIILIFVISCLSGHVLLSPMVTSYIALLFLISKNNEVNNKNILLVSNMYPDNNHPHYGIFVKNVYEILKENDYKIDIVVMHKKNSKLNKVIAYLKFYLKSFWLSLWNNYEYIYVHFISHSTLGVILPVITSKNTKLVLNAHGNDLVKDEDKEIKNEKRSRFYLQYAAFIIAPSNYFKDVLIKKYGISKNKIVVYPSGGVDLNVFKKNNKIKKKENCYGYVSRIEKDKGYDTFILAINELKKQKKLTDKKFLIVGSGSEENILHDLIKKYKLSRYIKVMPLVSQEELVKIYNEITALIYPTRRKSESLGLTGLEAMACETLVIGSNKYGPSSYLVDNENSITFNPEDYHELALKIEEVSKMKKTAKNKLIKKAKETSILYSSENTKDIILNVFKN